MAKITKECKYCGKELRGERLNACRFGIGWQMKEDLQEIFGKKRIEEEGYWDKGKRKHIHSQEFIIKFKQIRHFYKKQIKKGFCDIDCYLKFREKSIKIELERQNYIQKLKDKHLKGKGESYLYFIKMGNQNLVKIGISQTPKQRLKELQTANPFKLYIINTLQVNNARELERKFHKIYDGFRMKGEWFKLPLREIKRIKKEPIEILFKRTA